MVVRHVRHVQCTVEAVQRNPSLRAYSALFHGRTRTAYLHRCVWSGITGR